MPLCPRCVISRALKTKYPLAKPIYSPQRFPRTFSSWSCFPPSRLLPLDRSSDRLAISKLQLRSSSSSTLQPSGKSLELPADALPICCPGCGAYAQTVEPNEPGYYSKSRKQTRKLFAEKQKVTDNGEENKALKEDGEDSVTDGENADDSTEQLGKPDAPTEERQVGTAPPKPTHGALIEEDPATAAKAYLETSKPPTPVCDRCHDLTHHNKAVSAPTPSIYSIREFLNESPHRDNRVYHIVDAADFPMSLIPDIYDGLSLQEQRSRNRRAKTEKYKSGRKMPTVSFIVTRSDLLAATKEQVDSKMEYMRSVLRDALGKSNEDARFGNVHMISAHRGWWTKQVKEEIRDHGGGVWVVGKANVGKSSFIEACFPKDSRNLEKIADLIGLREEESNLSRQQEVTLLDPDSLLPPAPREDLYPVLPVVSSLPGTTVSPIRIPFGRGKGEMIDLPGLDRGRLEDYVRDEHKRDLIMTKRQKPERYTLKPGQSLLLGGGLVRITPVNPNDVVMAACFLPIEAHVTKTEKAVEMQTQQRAYPGTNIVKEGAGDVMASAGLFDLKWDVTHSHLPTAIAKAVEDRGVQPPPLPYKVMSTDILIEGCGWVELTTQIRTKSSSDTTSSPQVEVFSPNGKHIGSRSPIECWSFIAQKRASDKRKLASRGRQNIGRKRRAAHAPKL